MKTFLAQSERYGRTVWKLSGNFFPFLNPSAPSVSCSRLQLFVFLYCHSIFCSHPALSESLDILPALSLSFSLENKSISTSPFIYFLLSQHLHILTYIHTHRCTDNNSNSHTYTYIQCYFYCVKSCHLGLLVSTICHMIHLGADSKVLNLA